MKKLLMVILTMMLSFSILCQANPIQPIDNYIAKTLKWNNTKLATKISDYMVAGIITAPYVYVLAEKRNKFKKASTIALIQVFNTTLANTVKIYIGRERPSGKNKKSFYSGHTSTAFTNAGLICSLHKDSCFGALLFASTIGYLRVASNWHWCSDVIAGAGIGLLNGKVIPTLLISF